eukprot:TRINITY_DN1054_c0_g1_i1.p1 TRINITY_DN1054_c0_g1~~TRINITY_DN1054_c0_g1_i1.p1  ORF type:complete len:709 (+),score=174.97 TRINITY_DN1054_c0_g1_i1:70-2196(+)
MALYISDSTPISEVIHVIISNLKLPTFTGAKLEQMENEWTRTFQQHLIFNAGLLQRLSPARLSRLNLPLLLEEEMLKLLTTRKKVASPLLSFPNSKSIESHVAHRNSRFNLSLSDLEKNHLRATWEKLEISQDSSTTKVQFIRTFYPTFFQLNPPSERLFQGLDTAELGGALTRMLEWIIKHMDRLDAYVSVLAHMGGRHELYGVVQEDFQSFGKAVALTLQKVLGHNIVTNEIGRIWESAIVEIGDLMKEAGDELKLGKRGQLYREKGNGSWATVYVNMTLDTIYVFKDENFTELKGQYSIREIEGVSIQADTTMEYCFALETETPIRFATEDKGNRDKWIDELDWRIRSIQRVYLEETDSESDLSQSVTQDQVLINRLARTKLKIEAKKKSQLNVNAPANIELNAKNKALVKEGWKLLIETQFPNEVGGNERALARFFDEFYRKFFEVNPSGKRLFEEGGMAVQSKALVKMMSMVVTSLDNPSNLDLTIERLGGRHELYGVSRADYLAFTNAMCETLETVLGDKCNLEMKESWSLVLNNLSEKMLTSGKLFKQKAVKATLWRKFGRKGEWKKSTVVLTLDHLHLYRDEKLSKLRSSIPLLDINSIELIGENGVDPITEFGFYLDFNDYRQPILYLCTDSRQDMTFWVDELNWRAQALARVWKEEGDSTLEDNDSLKLYKSLSKLKKRKARKKSTGPADAMKKKNKL